MLPRHLRLRSRPQLARHGATTSPTPRHVFVRPRFARCQSTTPPPGPSAAGHIPQAPTYGGDFTVPLRIVGQTILRVLRFTFIGGTLVATIGLTAYTASHMYVEYNCLEPDDLEPGKDWDFALEREKWTGRRDTGRRGGGTDTRLGWTGQQLVRSAWMAQHWGVGPDELFEPSSDVDMFGFAVPAREYAYGRLFLRNAIEVCKKRVQHLGEFPGSDAAQDLLARYAEVLERIGGRRFVLDAREKYRELAKELAEEHRAGEAARIGAKVGDVSRRLGEVGKGIAWWIWAVRTASGDTVPLPSDRPVSAAVTATEELVPAPTKSGWFGSKKAASSAPPPLPVPDFIPTELPKNPLAQRSIANALVSLSAAYSEEAVLTRALALQNAGLALLTPPPTSSSPSSSNANSNSNAATSGSSDPPAKTLHTLSLSHAAALLSLHRAEVLYTLSPSMNHTPALSSLLASAHASEHAISLLSGIPLRHPDFPASPLPAPPAPRLPLAPNYAKSVVLRDPARRLLRDARRAAAHAWALAAVLHERKGEWARAYDCAERGLGWVGGEESFIGSGPGAGTPVPAEATGVKGWFGLGGKAKNTGEWEGLEVERREVWEVWRRVRERTLKEVKGAKVVAPPA